MQNKEERYWEEYYKSRVAPEEPSSFARYVMKEYAREGQLMIEMGCGNGRDARFFAQNNVRVTAVDMCAREIDVISHNNEIQSNLQYVTEDFTNLADADCRYNLVYSRFTLHSVDVGGQARTLDWSYRNLSRGGLLCIETRGQKNELYKKGEPVTDEQDAFILDNHYRRFVDLEKFKKDIEAAKFKILEASEQKGYAPFGDTDYFFIRIIAQKD